MTQSIADIERSFAEFHEEQARLSASIRQGVAELSLLAGGRRFRLSRADRAVKRAVDIAVGGIVLMLALPFMAVTALFLKVLCPTSPAIVRVRRIGKGGTTFWSYYFRTPYSVAMAENDSGIQVPFEDQWKGIRERFECFLSDHGLDGLPLLLNVIKGEMSLVGPRPLFRSEFERLDNYARLNYALAPGVTGKWRIEHYYGRPLDDIVAHDCAYVQAWSLVLDLSVLVKSLPEIAGRLFGRRKSARNS